MDIENIKKRIKDYISDLTGIDAHTISDSDKLIGDLGVDSIVIVQLFVSCQEDFGIEASDEFDLSADLSIDEVAEMVFEKIKEKETKKE